MDGFDRGSVEVVCEVIYPSLKKSGTEFVVGGTKTACLNVKCIIDMGAFADLTDGGT